ncbi:unnamed protein product [Nippostrongylus brasiliensis]|uniref:Smdr2 (inferred by orthology to a S. mansoni protein) n=1 Tax=Nippostrongylus brasiliensis TaxID=27835 RepID=A0A0N4YUN1_NIPBR|nr:unnamed protein product [Nippostrongylus brasiliensis]
MLKEEPPIDGVTTNGKKPSITGAVVLKNVHFKYPQRSDVPVLCGLNMESAEYRHIAPLRILEVNVFEHNSPGNARLLAVGRHTIDKRLFFQHVKNKPGGECCLHVFRKISSSVTQPTGGE